MGRIHKTMTPAAEAANRANGAESGGPASEAGKDQSKMNALKHGKYAARPDPVELLLAAPSPEEEVEREALRAEAVQCYQPPDAFARQAAEELADLRFELRRLERVKQALWQRERELLEVEQRRRAQAVADRVQEFASDVSQHQVKQTGVMQAPESPHKYRELLVALDWLKALMEGRRFRQAWGTLAAIYGNLDPSWRGHKLTLLLHRAEKAAEADPSAETKRQIECWLGMFRTILADELREVQAKLELCEQEQGPLTEAGQAMWLLEATSSRKWAWVRQQENFLRRSIDRRLRIQIELRRDHAKAERQLRGLKPASGGGEPRGPGGVNGGGGSGRPERPGAGGEAKSDQSPAAETPASRLTPASAMPSVASSSAQWLRKSSSTTCRAKACPGRVRPKGRPYVFTLWGQEPSRIAAAGLEQAPSDGREARGKNMSNRGTNPPSALESVRVRRPRPGLRLFSKPERASQGGAGWPKVGRRIKGGRSCWRFEPRNTLNSRVKGS